MGTKYQPKSIRNELETQVRNDQRVVDDPALLATIEKKRDFIQNHERNKKQLADTTPPDIESDEQRKELEQRERLLGSMIIHGNPARGLQPMNSLREQMQSPAGAVGGHLRHEDWIKKYTLDGNKLRKRNKAAGEQGVVDQWKDTRRILLKEAEDHDPDIGNIEILRPEDKSGESKFINYRKMSFAPGASMTVEHYNAATGHEPNEIEKALDDPDAKPPSAEQIYAQPPTKCKAVTAKGTRCKRDPLSNSKFCGLKAHQAQEMIGGD